MPELPLNEKERELLVRFLGKARAKIGQAVALLWRVEAALGVERSAPLVLPDPPLTEREERVLKFLAEGHTNREIASRLGVSINTIATHLKGAYSKLGVHSRTQAVAWMLRFRRTSAAQGM